MILTLAAVAVVLGQAPECKSDYGVTQCGYSCVADYGEVRCASTPQGACQAAYGEVVCFDPPYTPGAPPAQCIAEYGEIRCGYSCVAAYGEIRCARSPFGVCRAAYGEIVCYEPQRRRHHRRR